MKTSVIIIHWNTPLDLKTQLTMLKPSKNLEVIVVDNASDEEVELPKGVVFIQNKQNVGFAAACNLGAKKATGDWLLFLNPDTQISTMSIEKFIGKAEELGLDAASPKQSSDNYFKPLPTPLSLVSEFSPLKRVVTASNFKRRTLFGGCLLIRSEILRKIGGWDEDFFLWFEDSDLTKRLYDKHFHIGWVPVTYSHQGGSSFKRLRAEKRLELFFHSMNLYAKKHFSVVGRLVVSLLTVLNRA